MSSTKPVYVIGHRNPDTDSICSAISYANLKRAMERMRWRREQGKSMGKRNMR